MSVLIPTMSPSSKGISTGVHHRQTASRLYPSAHNRQNSRRPSADETVPKDGRGLEDLYWDNEDESFEVPDFHFDWGVAKEKTKMEMDVGLEDGLRSLGLDAVPLGKSAGQPDPIGSKTDTTPPSRGPHSAQSSTSSAHVMSMTDASTASASSLLPTPPNPGETAITRSISSQDSESSGSSGGQPGRTYASRSFQRVVSAPLARQRYEGELPHTGLDDISVRMSRVGAVWPDDGAVVSEYILTYAHRNNPSSTNTYLIRLFDPSRRQLHILFHSESLRYTWYHGAHYDIHSILYRSPARRTVAIWGSSEESHTTT